MGNGFPIAAVVTTPEIGAVLTQALHFNTFGGNPLSCAVGSAVLDVIKEDKLQENSLEVGTLFLQELAKMRDEFKVDYPMNQSKICIFAYIHHEALN